MYLLNQVVELLQKQGSRNLSQNLGRGGAWLFKQIAGHVLLLVVGITATGWWMTQDDSWKSYVQTGCNPSPDTYSLKKVPRYIAENDPTWQELTESQQSYIVQLLGALSDRDLDRGSVRAACNR